MVDCRSRLTRALVAYLEGRISARELEGEVVGIIGLPCCSSDRRLQDAIDAVDVALMELGDGLIHEGELRDVVAGALRGLLTTVMEARGEAFTLSDSQSTTVLSDGRSTVELLDLDP